MSSAFASSSPSTLISYNHQSMGHCKNHSSCEDDDKSKRNLILTVSISISITLSISITVPLTLFKFALRPTNVSFNLQDMTIYQFNQTSPTTLTTSLHPSLSSHNPTSRFSLCYASLRIYATYHDEPITLPAHLPPGFLGYNDNCLWSPLLYGVAVPLPPFLAEALAAEQAAGSVTIDIKVDVRLKWKFGTVSSGNSDVHASCPVVVVYGSNNENVEGDGFRLQMPVGCSASV